MRILHSVYNADIYLWQRGAYDYESARACQDLLVGIDKSLLTSIKWEIINKLQSSELDSTSFRQNNDKLLWWCSWMIMICKN
jgi:hypothetical protein